MQEVKKRHAQWLRDNRHMRYMWIPHTDAIVVVTANPLPENSAQPKQRGRSYSEAEKTDAFQQLLRVRRTLALGKLVSATSYCIGSQEGQLVLR